MGTIRMSAVAQEDGRLVLEDASIHKGETFEVIALQPEPPRPTGTVADLLNSEAVGLWADRDDIGDSVEYARELRRTVQENLRGQ